MGYSQPAHHAAFHCWSASRSERSLNMIIDNRIPPTSKPCCSGAGRSRESERRQNGDRHELDLAGGHQRLRQPHHRARLRLPRCARSRVARPVSRRRRSVMVGGTQKDFDMVLPVLKMMGENITLVGGVGDGQTAKVANQIIVALTIRAVSEGLLFASKAGADPAKVRGALMGGLASSKILEMHGQRMTGVSSRVPVFRCIRRTLTTLLTQPAASTYRCSPPRWPRSSSTPAQGRERQARSFGADPGARIDGGA